MPARRFGPWSMPAPRCDVAALFARWATDRHRRRHDGASVGRRHGAAACGNCRRPATRVVIKSMAFSPTDSRLLAVGHGGLADVSYVALWDVDTGTELARLPGATDLPDFRRERDQRADQCAAFSPDGKYLVAGYGITPGSLGTGMFSSSSEGLGGRHAPTDPPPEGPDTAIWMLSTSPGTERSWPAAARTERRSSGRPRPGKRRRRSGIPIRPYADRHGRGCGLFAGR